MTASTATRARLSDEQVKHYQAEGYVIYPEAIFPDAKFNALKAHFEQKLARLPDDVRPESMDVPHFTDPALFEWLLADEVLDLVEPILGPDIALWSSHFLCKPSGNGKRVPWHEDSFYWKGRLDPMEVVTVWLAIDPSLKINGCMNVIPRTLHGYSDYENVAEPAKSVFTTEIKKTEMDASHAVAMELQPNHASLHDARLIHGSQPNTSSQRRCGYTMRYMSASTRMTKDKGKVFHQIYLARGKDRAGNDYADPTKAYPELALYREVSGNNGH